MSNLGLLRIDVDLYEPTLSTLEKLYPKIILGGYVIIDDYGLPLDCKAAVDHFRETNGIREIIIKINHQAVYWQKSESD